MTEWRTANSRHYLLADGTYRAQAFLIPIHYQEANGSFQPIDTGLTTTNRTGFAAANETNTIRTYLPDTAAGWVRVESGKTAISFRPIGAATVPIAISGSSATFAGVAENISVDYRVEPGRLKEAVALTAPLPSAKMAFELDLEGLEATKRPDNSIDLRNAESEPTLTIPPPWMQDATGAQSTAIKVEWLPKDGGFVYSLEPDPTWLATARYPVVIDPEIATPHTTETVRLTTPSTAYRPGVLRNGNYRLAVGVPSANLAEVYRSELYFESTGLPLDCDVTRATLHLTTSEQVSDEMQIRALSVPTLWRDGWTDWAVVDDAFDADYALTERALSSPPVELNDETESVDLDVTGIVMNWTDDGNQAKTIVLADVTDIEERSSYLPALAYFYPANIEVSINYVMGWYTFQGNSRRTGRTRYEITDPSKQWGAAVTIPHNTRIEQYLEPSVLAVPDPENPTGPYPIVYAALGHYSDADGYATQVARIVDGGTTYSKTQQELTGIYATGTPLLVGDILVIVGNTQMYGGTGRAVGLDADTLQTVWTRDFDGTVYSSPVFSAKATVYKTQDNAWHTNTEGAILLSVNHVSIDPYSSERHRDGIGGQSTALMHALRPSDGYHVWGVVSSLGAYISGLTDLKYNATYSSPAHNGQHAFSQDHSCYVNARDLRDGDYQRGSALWEISTDGLHEESSISIMNGKLYWAGMVPNTESGSATCVSEWESPPTDFYGFEEWLTFADRSTGQAIDLPNIWPTMALFSDQRIAIFGDDLGKVHGFGLDEDGDTYLPETAWTSATTLTANTPVRCSALIAGVNYPTVFVGSDDEYIHVLSATSGTHWSTLGDGGNALNGKVRGSLAAYKGRLYAVTAGRIDQYGSLSASPTVYCFANSEP